MQKYNIKKSYRANEAGQLQGNQATCDGHSGGQ